MVSEFGFNVTNILSTYCTAILYVRIVWGLGFLENKNPLHFYKEISNDNVANGEPN